MKEIVNTSESAVLEINSKPSEFVDENKDSVIHPQEENTLLDNTRSEKYIPKESIFLLFKGILYSILSALCFSFCSVIVKYLHDINPSEIAMFRYFGIFVLSIPQIAYNRLNPFGPRDLRLILIIRGALGGMSLLLRFYCLYYLPIAEATVIVFSFPIVATIFAKIFLKEPFGRFQVIIILLTVIGLTLIVKLPLMIINNYSSQTNETYIFNSTLNYSNSSFSLKYEHKDDYNRLIGISSGILSTIFVSLAYITLRMAKKANSSVVVFNLGWVALTELSVITYALNGYSLPVGIYNWSLIGLLVFFSYFGQLFLTKSLQLEQCSPIAVIRSTVDILLSFLWQIFLFKDDKLDIWSVSGGLIITLAIIFTTLRKYVISLPKDSKMKKSLHLITK